MDDNFAQFDKKILMHEATWWQMELPSGRVIFGDSKAEMLGYPSDNFKTYQDFTALIHKDDYQKAMDAMLQHLHGKKRAYETSYRIKTSSGDYITFYDYGVKSTQEEGKITLVGFVMKVNDPKKIDEEIKAFKSLVTGGRDQ